ncbi:MAG: 4-hydroxy-tetrahydrodipicolinate synthase [Nitrospinae bacterium]|nr:4-hydroxy-tetrahydrodipicolinate synthase [Nitrospinota bacterium]
MFSGSWVAVVTPFNNNAVDEAALADLVNWHVEKGTNGIVAVGTTGESPTLSHEEHHKVVEICVKAANKRIPVMAGTGSNSTDEAIDLTAHAKKAGADAVLLVNPYYNKPTQEGLYRHYMAIADAVDIPQIVYNIPGRTGGKIETSTMARLATHPNIVGLKDACGDLAYTSEIISRTSSDFSVLSGDDGLTLPMMSIGAKGVISVAANVVPDKIAALTAAALAGDFGAAREIHYSMWDLMNSMFYETNPIPVKTALAMMGRIREEFRLPLCQMGQANRERLQTVMQKCGLLAEEAARA